MLLYIDGSGGRLRSRYWFERQFGQAEVQNFGVATISDKDVSGLNVAMYDSFGVRGIKRVGDLDGEREQNVQIHGTMGDAVLQRCAFEELHGNERLPRLFTDVIYRADVGMIQGRCGLRLPLKPGEGVRISGYMLRQKLERDQAMQASILSFVNYAHPA